MSTCSVCGEVIGSQPWLLLNRYGVGTGPGGARCLTEIVIDEEYIWEQGGWDEEDYASGAVVCWPDCAYTYIEGKMIQVQFEVDRYEDEDGEEESES